jgi:hypothetical protein
MKKDSKAEDVTPQSGVFVGGVPAENIPGALIDLSGPVADATTETLLASGVAAEVVDVKRTPRNQDHCIVVRPDFDAQRAYCSIDRGSHQVEEPFRVNGKITEEEQAAAGEDQAALLTAFAKRIADVVTTEALQRDIEVARVPNSQAGQATAAALREAGFTVVEFAE